MAEDGAWIGSGAPRGDEYERQLAARLAGEHPHGEADFVEDLMGRCGFDRRQRTLILDGGCGTGRVAIELARRGRSVVGVDSDGEMLAVARRKAPDLRWVLADLAEVDLEPRPDIAVLAGNVMIFVGRGREAAVLANLARQLEPGGLLVAGFQLGPGRLGIDEYDRLAGEAGLELRERWATWDREAWLDGRDYAVSVHQRS